MTFADKHREEIIAWYEEGLSTYQIAEKLDTYPTKISRALKALGIERRSKSEAQKNALETGRHKHPTKGKERKEEVKIKISESVAKNWDEMSDAERDRRAQIAKDNWDAMTEQEKEELRAKAAEAVRLAAKNGSKMEHFLKDHLTKAGYEVILHVKGLIANTNLEIDLYLPQLNVAIEVDGPAHFEPIWGVDSHQRHVRADAEKAGLILKAGFAIIRIKHLARTLTEKHKRDTGKAVLEELAKIEKKFPPKNKRFIELEIK